MSDPKRVLFVCHGNICRSPMAEFIMKDIAAGSGASERYVVDSCATSSEALGEDMYPPAKAKLREKGVPFSPRRAKRMTPAMYGRYDVIAVMDRNNLRNLRGFIGDDPDGKVRMLKEFSGSGGEIADPWYTGDFETAYNEIRGACLAMFDSLEASE